MQRYYFRNLSRDLAVSFGQSKDAVDDLLCILYACLLRFAEFLVKSKHIKRAANQDGSKDSGIQQRRQDSVAHDSKV